MKTILLAWAATLAGHMAAASATAPPLSEPPPGRRDARMAWFREARFGMFIHWGLYAIPAGRWNGAGVHGTGEWLQTNAPIQVADYEPLKSRFNPVHFDAGAWAKTAKRAGMKYVVITSKHHDGFALFDSQGTDWDVAATPFRRDILRELADACRAEGIRLGWYYSILDWHHPDYLPRRGWDVRPADGADFDRYVAFMKGQLTELLTNYGPVDVLWFDGEWEETWTHERGLDLDAFVRRLQHEIIVNNRVDKGRHGMAGLNAAGDWAGDFGTPEQEVPHAGIPGVDWESCMTMNDTWGFRSDDENWKSSTRLIRTLCEVASKGGNFLLNVGPTADGLIPEASLERLADIGQWMDVNAESIHATGPSPFPRPLPWGRCTSKPGVLYLHVFDWPRDRRLVIPGLLNDIAGASILGSSWAVTPERRDDDVVLALPPEPVHEAATVIRIEIIGAPRVAPPRPIGAGSDGVVLLAAADAELHGPSLRLEDRWGSSLGFWVSPDAHAAWNIQAPPGVYEAELDLSCASESAGSEFLLWLGDQAIAGVVPDTGGWGEFRPFRCGRFEIPDGPVSVTLRPGAAFTGALMNLRAVRLIPVAGEP